MRACTCQRTREFTAPQRTLSISFWNEKFSVDVIKDSLLGSGEMCIFTDQFLSFPEERSHEEIQKTNDYGSKVYLYFIAPIWVESTEPQKETKEDSGGSWEGGQGWTRWGDSTECKRDGAIWKGAKTADKLHCVDSLLPGTAPEPLCPRWWRHRGDCSLSRGTHFDFMGTTNPLRRPHHRISPG